MTKNTRPTALVTGGTGFIGFHLIKKLITEGNGVRTLVRPDSIHVDRLKGVDVDIFEGNLANAEAVHKSASGIKTIYHVGAATSHSNWEDIYQSNIKGTEYLVQAAVAQQVERLVLISDAEVYDLLGVKRGIAIKEDSPLQEDPKNMSLYTYSKIKNEKLVFEAYRNDGLEVTVVRPGMVVGPMGQIFFPHLGYNYQKKLFLIIGKGNNILPLIYVENLVDGLYKAANAKKAIGQVYNCVDDLEITVRRYIEQFIQTTGVRVRIVPLPYALPYLAISAYEIGAYIGLLKKGVTSRSQFKWKHAPMHFDNSKAKNELEWHPSVSIKQGLERTFKWYVDQWRLS